MTAAIALYSGGLDSTLAILSILKQGVKIRAIKFFTNFEFNKQKEHLYLKSLSDSAKKFGFDLVFHKLDDKFINVLLNPKHGYGKNINPCIDCRILMLKEAKKIMDEINADFIITGEVLGQRPMSQRKDMLYHIDKEAGVCGYVVRPLSAKLLKITIPEEKGIIDREMLYDFCGRSRKKQVILAKEFSLQDYPTPAGGCLLTDPIFSRKVKDLLKYTSCPSKRDFELLKIGRHFRISPFCKIVVGRDNFENEVIKSLSKDEDCLLRVEGFGSPLTLMIGEVTNEALNIAASICARYSDAKNLFDVEVIGKKGINQFRLRVPPASEEVIKALRI